MRVLHYILGFPPMRSGGLTKYAIDLMHAQKLLGHDVFAIYPGNPSLFSWKISIYNEGLCCGIPSYKIRNALLLPLPPPRLMGKLTKASALCVFQFCLWPEQQGALQRRRQG
ncbi:hypothetical protein B0H50_13418 [Hallerella porci]|uniref:Uncharacterized protein n=1 Tax=Hallerella porci TaxID=1945871 RepID=A0ABX5LL48_9BACT|nr:hypothetical protein B0H50_13418 [Hallerella porci]